MQVCVSVNLSSIFAGIRSKIIIKIGMYSYSASFRTDAYIVRLFVVD